MAISSRTSIVFNIAAILIAASATGAAVRSWLVKPSVAPCETRYSNVLAFKLERDGRMLSAIDLQGRAGGRDIGLDRNVEIAAVSGAPKPIAMKVQMPTGDGSALAGMSFPWEPANIRPHAAACLAYNVRLSDNLGDKFDGVLPGLQGATDSDPEQHFIVSPAWVKTGEAGLATDVVLKREPNEPAVKPSTSIDGTEVPLAKGRWLRINQEVVLNAPEETDGIVRVWVDGKLVIDRTDMRLRSEKSVGFTGVAARAHMLADTPKAAGSADSSVQLTAFELMW